MLDKEAMKILDSPWVQELDDFDETTGFGFALKEGAPEEFVKEYEEFVELFTAYG